jgi:hypothetical protein
MIAITDEVGPSRRAPLTPVDVEDGALHKDLWPMQGAEIVMLTHVPAARPAGRVLCVSQT